MRVASLSASSKPALSVDPRSSVKSDVKSTSEDVLGIPIDHSVTEMEVGVCSFKSQTNKQEKVQLIIFQVNERPNLLCAFS